MSIPKHLLEAKICNESNCKYANFTPNEKQLHEIVATQSVEIADLKKKINKAIELIKKDNIIVKRQEFENKYTVNFYDKKKDLLNILEGGDE